jgi:hypothetical protein
MNSTRHPFSTSASPMAHAEWVGGDIYLKDGMRWQ